MQGLERGGCRRSVQRPTAPPPAWLPAHRPCASRMLPCASAPAPLASRGWAPAPPPAPPPDRRAGWAARGGSPAPESRAFVGRGIILRDSRTRGRCMAIRISRSAMSAEGLGRRGKKKARERSERGRLPQGAYSALQQPPPPGFPRIAPALRRMLPCASAPAPLASRGWAPARPPAPPPDRRAGWAARGGSPRRESRAFVGRAIILRDSRTRGRAHGDPHKSLCDECGGTVEWGKKKRDEGSERGRLPQGAYSALQQPPRLASRVAPLRFGARSPGLQGMGACAVPTTGCAACRAPSWAGLLRCGVAAW